MKRHLNTLFVMTPGAYLSKRGESVVVRIEKEVKASVPLHNIGAIVCFGGIGCSPSMMEACADAGIAVSFMKRSGRLLAKVSGFTSGNVLLRREQYRRADSDADTAAIAKSIILAKVANSRTVLLRAAREAVSPESAEPLTTAANHLGQSLDMIETRHELDVLRGYEGEAARTYYNVFNWMIRNKNEAFVFHRRSKRPPLDVPNAMLSFLYAMLANDARSACEAAGLDAGIGYLHRDRPGRPGLAMDLIEEFRAYLADRVVLTLINRQQVAADGFESDESGAVRMNDETRKVILATYQKRKQVEIEHPFLKEKTTIGLLIHLQARLLSRYLRGELDAYPAFIARG
ncbi:MAG: type I-C CRISPR-associated endonuclease Cas1c [Phycisphaerae bacterium]|nr:type I-C CRISPR-associated endonuclease Cas1 [Phycisphaerales bacterium]